MTTETIFGGTSPGTSTANDANAPRVFGGDFQVSASGTIPSVRYYIAGPTLPATVNVAIYDPTNSTTTPLASGSAVPTVVGWLVVPLAASVTPVLGHTYTAAAEITLSSGGTQPYYGFIQGGLATDAVSGDLKMLAHTGRFVNNVSGMTYPAGTGDYNFLVDIVFNPTVVSGGGGGTPPPAGEMPDVEYMLIGWLSQQAGLTPSDGVLVSDAVPLDYDGSQSVVRIVRIGGGLDPHLEFRFDHARIDIDCFGPTKAAAQSLLGLARRAVLHNLKWGADVSSWGAAVTDATEYVGPQWFDEPGYPPAGRYLTQVGITVHPV